jgi:hypothetical protein
MKLSVYNTEGKETSKSVTLSKDIFGIEPNDHAVYLDVKHFLAAQRQGTHKSKERSDVSGSRRKLRKQKGSGAANALVKQMGLGYNQDLETKVANYGKQQATALECMLAASWK